MLTSGISRPRRTPLASGANVSKEVPGVAQRNDVRKIQELCRTTDNTGRRSMASLVSEPGRAFADFRRLRICRSQGSLIPRRPANLASDQRVASRPATRLHLVNLRQASSGMEVRGEPVRHYGGRSTDRPLQSRRRSVDRTRKNTMESLGAGSATSCTMNR